MTERILRHKKPADVPFSIKRYLEDKWDRIPKWQKDFKCCLDCGLPTMRLDWSITANQLGATTLRLMVRIHLRHCQAIVMAMKATSTG